MLATTYRIQAVNNTGVAFAAADTIIIKAKRWNIDSTGKRYAETAEALLTAAGAGNSLASGGIVNTNTQDNTAASTFWFGGEFTLQATISTATPSGTVDFYMQASTDGGTSWPDNGTGELIRSLPFTATGTLTRVIEF